MVKPTVPDDEKKTTNYYREKLYSQITAGNARVGEKSQDSHRRGQASGR